MPNEPFLATPHCERSPASGQIWSNSENDPGALYNSAGQLVSYWPD
jgi:hypothetical protein